VMVNILIATPWFPGWTNYRAQTCSYLSSQYTIENTQKAMTFHQEVGFPQSRTSNLWETYAWFMVIFMC
jgi:hypothetical protein